MTTRERCAQALADAGLEAIYGKGGFWINGSGFFTLREVCKQYNITPEPRKMRGHISAYGDLATIAYLNGVKS